MTANATAAVSSVDSARLIIAALTMAAGIIAAICSHFNDSGFWLVKSLVGLDDLHKHFPACKKISFSLQNDLSML